MCPADMIPVSESREVLIEAALACFAKYGYEATTIRLVASMAGKNSDLISYYFGGKEGLYRAVFQFLIDRFPTAQPPPVDQATLGDGRLRLRAHLRRVLAEVGAQFDGSDPLQEFAVRLWLSELHAPKHEVKDLLQKRMEPFAEELRACLRTLRPDFSPADVDFLGVTLHSCCIGHTLMIEINRLIWTASNPPLSLDAIADRLTNLACQGLVANSCEPTDRSNPALHHLGLCPNEPGIF